MLDHADHTAENVLNTIVDAIAENIPKHKSVSFLGDESSTSATINRLFGRQKSVHHILGGGKSADVLLWKDKKMSSSIFVAATLTWVLFEWLNYHFLSLICFALIAGILIQFAWSNASGLLNRSPSEVPRVVLPKELFVNIAVSAGAQINRFLEFIQDAACGRNMKQLISVIAGLLAAAIIGSWCNFLTVLYIGYIAAHTLPAFYDTYEDQVDGFIYKVLGQFQSHYRKIDEGLLSKIPKGNLNSKKDA